MRPSRQYSLGYPELHNKLLYIGKFECSVCTIISNRSPEHEKWVH